MKWDVLKQGLTSGATYNASAKDYYTNIARQYEQQKRQQEEYQKRKREYEKQLKIAAEKKAKLERERIERLEKLKNETSVKEREDSAVRAQEKLGRGETPTQREADLFEVSDYKKQLTNHSDDELYEKAWRKFKDFFLSADGITATGQKVNEIQASQFSGNLEKSREDQMLINMAEDFFKGNKTINNAKAIQELNRRKPGLLNSAAVQLNKALDWIGNNSVTGTTGAFLGTDELDKVRIGIDFDENTTSEQALQNIQKLRNAYKAFDEESYSAYLENHNKAKYYENLLSNDYKHKVAVAEGRIPDENGVTDGSVEFFNFSKLRLQLPGIIAGSISSPSQLISSVGTGLLTASRIAATATAATAAAVGTGGWGAVAVPAILAAGGAATTYGINQAQGGHENAAEVDEAYVSKVRYALEQHPKAALDFYERGRSILGKHATEEEIIVAKLANKIPSVNKTIDKVLDEAATGSQRQYDRDMVATTLDSTIDTALQITPLRFFTTWAKPLIKSNLRASRIARFADNVSGKIAKLNGGDGGVLRKAFAKSGMLVSGEFAAGGAMLGTLADNTIGRIPKVGAAIKAMAQFDVAKIRKIGPKSSAWLTLGGAILKRGSASAVSEGVEEGKQFYNQQRAVKEFQDGLANNNLSFETQTMLGDVLDDFQAGNFAAAGLVNAIFGIPLLDAIQYKDVDIINAAEAIKNIKSGMLGGHAQTSLMTGIPGLVQTIGTHGAINDMELAIMALENSKLEAQKQFAQDEVLSRTSSKYTENAIRFLRNSDYVKNNLHVTDEDIDKLQARAIEVRGVSKSPITKQLAKELGIPKENYHKFVADYMYHKDNLEAERENQNDAANKLNEIATQINQESHQIFNPADDIADKWSKNDIENERNTFENKKNDQIKTLQDHLKSLKEKLEKQALNKSQRAETEADIAATEESLKKVEESKFDESKVISYGQARFDRINTLARIRGAVKQLNFLNDILSTIDDENTSGKEFVQKQIDETKKLLNNWLKGCLLDGKPLSIEKPQDIDEFIRRISTQISQADNDNMHLMGATAELSNQIEALSQAYQEYSNATLNYNIASDLFNRFLGYDVNDKNEIVRPGTEGSKHIKGNAKQHLDGIIASQDDDAQLEQAYQQGFADYGYSGVYKNDSHLVRAEEEENEAEHPGTTARRQRIRQLGQRISSLYSKARSRISGKWTSFGFKNVFTPNAKKDVENPDMRESQRLINELYNELRYEIDSADDADKWLDNISDVLPEDSGYLTNSQAFIETYLRYQAEDEEPIDPNITISYDERDNRLAHIFYKGIEIGTARVFVIDIKAGGREFNNAVVELNGVGENEFGLHVQDLRDSSKLESLIHPEVKKDDIIRTEDSGGKIRLSLSSHTDENPRQIVLDPQGDNKFYVHIRVWDGEKIPGKIFDEDKKKLFDALYDELPIGAEILLPESHEGYYATRGTIAALRRLSRDDRFKPGTEGIVKYEDKDKKDGSTIIREYKGSSFIKVGKPVAPDNATDAQETKIQVLESLSEKMNNKFDVTLRTSSHYFEWYTEDGKRKLRLWHRLHDEIGSNFKQKSQDKKNWSKLIKELYAVVYKNGYKAIDKVGEKDISSLLKYLQNYYQSNVQTEALLNRIYGYVKYLEQEGNNITDEDLYDCIKGIAEEIAQEINTVGKNNSLDRGTAIDIICRTIFGREYRETFEKDGKEDTVENVIEYIQSLKMTDQSGNEVFVKDYFTPDGISNTIKRILSVRSVYEDELGYTLWTKPFTIYTEDYKNESGNPIRIAGEVDMLAIDKEGRTIIIDFKTSLHNFFEGKQLSTYFTSVGENIRSAEEQYTNQQSAYVEMLNETTRKETESSFKCNEARLFPIHLVRDSETNLLKDVEIEFSKTQQLILHVIPFELLSQGDGLILDKESYRTKLAVLSQLYARVEYIADQMEIWHLNSGNRMKVDTVRSIKESLKNIQLALQDITLEELDKYKEIIDNALSNLQEDYFDNLENVIAKWKQYKAGELELQELDRAHAYNNVNWDNPLNENDIDALGGFEAMGVKDRKEYDEKLDELAHVACNKDFQNNSTARLTAIPYKTRQGNDKYAVYATITYNNVTYPPIRLYLSNKNGDDFARKVAEGNTYGANIRTTVGLLSRCSDGNQHKIEESKQLVEAVGGTNENPYENFVSDADNNLTVGVVYFNKSTGALTTLTRGAGSEVALPRTLKKASANGHIVINVIPENSGSGLPIPIVCNTPKIDATLGKNTKKPGGESLLDFLVNTVLIGLNNATGAKPLNSKVQVLDKSGEIISLPLTYKQILDFFFEPYSSENGDLVQRPQYLLYPPVEGSDVRRIKIGDFSKNGNDGARIISLDDPKALRDAISKLSIWISTEMAGVRWDSSKPGSSQFNEFSEFLDQLEDGERFYLGNTNIYFDKTDAHGTYLGFLAKNGLLTTPFTGFSHPLISINTCQKEAPLSSPIIDDDGDKGFVLPDEEQEEDEFADVRDDDPESVLEWFTGNNSIDAQLNPSSDPYGPNTSVRKLQNGKSRLDESAAREYVEHVLGKKFTKKHLKFEDEICSAIIGGLSAGTIIAGQVTANMMRLCNYAENGTEYHETFHWVFELIMDPRESSQIRKLVHKKYGITGEREVAEWLADAYMHYVRRVYTPKGNLLQRAFDKIEQWAITFYHIFKDDYRMYKLFNDINSGKFRDKPINNEAVLKFQEKFKELNSTNPTSGYKRDGLSYKYQQGFTDHRENIKELAWLIMRVSGINPAAKYSKNKSFTINVSDVFNSNVARMIMMMEVTRQIDGKSVTMPGLSIEQLEKFSNSPKHKDQWMSINNALALRELIDDEHIEKTQEYVSAYIDEILGVKGKDISVEAEDEGSEETIMDQSYAKAEDGDYSSDAGSVAEHIVPDHQISRISKTSSRIKLFFSTIPIIKQDGKPGINKFGKYGYYEFREVYQYVQNKYHSVLSPEALWKAIENDSTSNLILQSLWSQISTIRNYAAKGNNNAIGLLNEIYKNIKSAKHEHNVIKTRFDNDEETISYRTADMLTENNSYAISREFTEIVLGGFNKYFKPTDPKKGADGKEYRGVIVRKKIYDERTGKEYDAQHRQDILSSFFVTSTTRFGNVVEEIDKKTKKRLNVQTNKVIPCIYDVIVSYGTRDAKPLYQKIEGDKYIELSVDNNAPYMKMMLCESLSALGIDISVEQLDDILETQFAGTGVQELKQLLTEIFSLPARGDFSQTGSQVSLYTAMIEQMTAIDSELANGKLQNKEPVIGIRNIEEGNRIKVKDGTDVFRRSKLHVLISTLLAKAQNDKYEVVGRAVDGKTTYAMSDDNTVTAMCDVIFDKTGDPQCTEIRKIILNDPFNIADGGVFGDKFGGIPLGSFILRALGDKTINHKLGYKIINDGGIETGNNENSSTNSDKRGADTIMSIIVKLCENMINLPPFADKSTALGVKLFGVQLPGIDYSVLFRSFRETGKEDTGIDIFNNYIGGITLLENGRIIPSSKDNELDRTIASYVLAEYYQAQQAIQNYEDLLRNFSTTGKEDGIDEKHKTALNICKKLMFMSQFSGDYVQDAESGEWTFNPFGVKDGSNKSNLQAAKEMLSQFERVVYDENSLLDYVNRHINAMIENQLETLLANGIITRSSRNKTTNNRPYYKNVLLDGKIIKSIKQAINRKIRRAGGTLNGRLSGEQAIRVFLYDIVGKAIISKQESERLFTGQSDLFEIVRDKETRIITIPYQDQAKRIGSFVSTGSVGVVEESDYVCAEIPDDQQSIGEQVERSIYLTEIAGYIQTGELDKSIYSSIDLRTASLEDIKNLIPKEFQALIDSKIKNAMQGFALKKKNGSENKNNVTDGASFISAKFAKRLLKSQGAWDNKIAKAFAILTSENTSDIEQILNSWETFNTVWTSVIGTQKYTSVGFRTEYVNGIPKAVQFVNKTALFPVFACMCNDKMEAIRKQMELQGVDMLMFESAVKVGAHGNSDFVVDNSGNTTGSFNTYTQKQFFLRKQLNTDPNEKETMKIGIQTVKVALSAIIGKKDIAWHGELVDGNVIIQQIMDDIKELSSHRHDKLNDKLSTTQDVTNYVARFLRQNNVPDSVVQEFLNGVPAEALSIQKHIDTLSVKRIQEDTVRINAPGSAFIQRSVYGVEGPGVKFGKLELNDGEELKVINSDGSMDCVLSIDYFIEYKKGIPYFKLVPKGQKKIPLLAANGKPMSFEQIRKWLKDSGVIGKNAKPSILSYRIPTQAVASINALKCVDVIPVVRDTVVLPKLFTTITGSDFDIDKLFMSTLWYEMEEQEDGTYKPVQISDKSTEEGMANTVVNDYVETLCATAKKFPEVFYKSIDQDTKLADDIIAEIKALNPLTDKDRQANASGILQAMPSMQAKVHDEFLAGKKGIGPFALALVNHVLTRIYGVAFNNDGIYLNHKSLSREEDDDENSIMAWLSAMINKHVDVAKNPDITYLNVNDSTFNIVALLLRLGYGRRTFMYICQGIMFDYAFEINQQTAVCKYTKNDDSYVDARRNAYKNIMKKYDLDDTRDSLGKHSKKEIWMAACREIFDKDLEDGTSLCEYVLKHHGNVPKGITIRIGNETFDLTDDLFKYLNLELFDYLSDKMAEPLSKLQQATVIDNERCITSMIQSSFYKQIVAEVKESNVFKNIDDLFEKSYIDDKLSDTTSIIDHIYDETSCMDKNVVVTVAKAIDPRILSYGKKRMNTFLSTVRDGMVAYYGAQFFDSYCREKGIDRRELFGNGKNSITRRLSEIQKSTKSYRGKYWVLRNNLLLRGLSIESIVGEEHIVPEENFYNKHRFLNYHFLRFKYAGQSDDSILPDVQQAWNELLEYPDEKIQNFARDLIVYSFYTSGEMSGKTKLFKYVPPEWRVSRTEVNETQQSYSEFFKEIKTNKQKQSNNIDNIIDKLCRNLWYKEQFVRKVSLNKLIKFQGSDILKTHTRSISISEEEAETVPDPILLPIVAGIEFSNNRVEPIFKGSTDDCPRYFYVRDTHHDRLTRNDDSAVSLTLYKLVGFNTYTDQSGVQMKYPVYVQTSVLGEKYYRNNVFEFNEELEPNENIDAYGIMSEFLNALGQRVASKEDVQLVLDDLMQLLRKVDLGVNLSFLPEETAVAAETIGILVNSSTMQSTFEPLYATNEPQSETQKGLENLQDLVCNRTV